MPQDFASRLGISKDLPARPAQPAENKRPAQGEGKGGYLSRPVGIPKACSPWAAFVPQCQGTKADGSRCGSPALRRQRFCYYHDPARHRGTGNRKLGTEAPLPDFRDPRKMLAWAMQNLAAGRISPKAAGQLIYAAQQLMG